MKLAGRCWYYFCANPVRVEGKTLHRTMSLVFWRSMVVRKLVRWLCRSVFSSYLSKDSSLNLFGKDLASISVERRKTSLIPKSSSNCFFYILFTVSINLTSRYLSSWFLVFLPIVSQLSVALFHVSSLFFLTWTPWILCGMLSPPRFLKSFVNFFNFFKCYSCVIQVDNLNYKTACEAIKKDCCNTRFVEYLIKKTQLETVTSWWRGPKNTSV